MFVSAFGGSEGGREGGGMVKYRLGIVEVENGVVNELRYLRRAMHASRSAAVEVYYQLYCLVIGRIVLCCVVLHCVALHCAILYCTVSY